MPWDPDEFQLCTQMLNGRQYSRIELSMCCSPVILLNHGMSFKYHVSTIAEKISCKCVNSRVMYINGIAACDLESGSSRCRLMSSTVKERRSFTHWGPCRSYVYADAALPFVFCERAEQRKRRTILQEKIFAELSWRGRVKKPQHQIMQAVKRIVLASGWEKVPSEKKLATLWHLEREHAAPRLQPCATIR